MLRNGIVPHGLLFETLSFFLKLKIAQNRKTFFMMVLVRKFLLYQRPLPMAEFL